MNGDRRNRNIGREDEKKTKGAGQETATTERMACLTEKMVHVTIPDEENAGYIRDYSELGISNDFMFGKIMENEERCRVFLEQILNIRIDHIENLDRQKTIDEKIDAHGVRLDIYVEDGKTVYNCEMQTAESRDLGKRSRYYQSQIDLSCLNKGLRYSELKKSYIIFICTFDPFGLNRYIYTFENRCLEDPEPRLHDDAIKMFVNTKGVIGEVNDGFRELMHFLDTSEKKIYQNPLVNDLSDALEKARTMAEWRHQYMTMEMMKRDILEEGIEKGINIGIEKGIEKGIDIGALDTLIVTVKSMMQRLDLKVDEAIEIAAVPEKYRSIVKEKVEGARE